MRVAKENTINFKEADYYPFGSEKPGRVFNSGEYKYGYNGKEMDNEVSGDGNSYDYGFRIYNPRLGRFLSVDPLTASYPWYTPYQFAGNDPIRNIDIDGLEGGSAIEYAFTDLGNSLESSWNSTKSWWSSWSLLPSTAPNKPADPINGDQSKPVLKKIDQADIKQAINSQSNNSFDKIFPKILKHEGGFKNEPLKDKGDPTNKGISWPIWQAYAKDDLGIEPTFKNLKSLSDDQAKTIYKKRYWDAKGFDDLKDFDVAYLMYDWSVTSGGAIKEIQKLLNDEFSQSVKTDGALGKETITAINNVDQVKLHNRIKDIRIKYYEKGADNGWFSKDYLKGLKNRVNEFPDKK